MLPEGRTGPRGLRYGDYRVYDHGPLSDCPEHAWLLVRLTMPEAQAILDGLESRSDPNSRSGDLDDESGDP